MRPRRPTPTLDTGTGAGVPDRLVLMRRVVTPSTGGRASVVPTTVAATPTEIAPARPARPSDIRQARPLATGVQVGLAVVVDPATRTANVVPTFRTPRPGTLLRRPIAVRRAILGRTRPLAPQTGASVHVLVKPGHGREVNVPSGPTFGPGHAGRDGDLHNGVAPLGGPGRHTLAAFTLAVDIGVTFARHVTREVAGVDVPSTPVGLLAPGAVLQDDTAVAVAADGIPRPSHRPAGRVAIETRLATARPA